MENAQILLFISALICMGFGLVVFAAIFNSIAFQSFIEGRLDPNEKNGRKFLAKLASILLFIGLTLLIAGLSFR